MIEIGDIVRIKKMGYNYNKLYIILACKNNENQSSYSYDRTYYLKDYDKIPKTLPFYIDNMDVFYDEIIEVKDIASIPFVKVNDIAPFEIKREVVYKVRRKHLKKTIKYEWE